MKKCLCCQFCVQKLKFCADSGKFCADMRLRVLEALGQVSKNCLITMVCLLVMFVQVLKYLLQCWPIYYIICLALTFIPHNTSVSHMNYLVLSLVPPTCIGRTLSSSWQREEKQSRQEKILKIQIALKLCQEVKDCMTALM